MAKFKVSAEIVIISTVCKIIDAEDLDKATIKLLQNVKNNDWKITKKLKTSTH